MCFLVPKVGIHATMSPSYGSDPVYERRARGHSIGLRTVMAYPDEASFATMHAEAQPNSQTPRSPSSSSSHMRRPSNSIFYVQVTSPSPDISPTAFSTSSGSMAVINVAVKESPAVYLNAQSPNFSLSDASSPHPDPVILNSPAPTPFPRISHPAVFGVGAGPSGAGSGPVSGAGRLWTLQISCGVVSSRSSSGRVGGDKHSSDLH